MANDLNDIESYWDTMSNTVVPLNPEAQTFGRVEVQTGVEEVTQENLQSVMAECLPVHAFNGAQIDYLYRYNRGIQPVLQRVKQTRPEINNKVVENHAIEVSEFVAAYFMGEPVVYVRHGDDESRSKDIETLNDFMLFEDKATCDMHIATWMAICGVGYRMCLPDKDAIDDPDLAPFELDAPDPRYTFIAYSTGFGHKRLMGVHMVRRKDAESGAYHWLYCGYTKTHYFEMWDGGEIVKWEPHTLQEIPIFEYRLNMNMLGSFEPAIPILNAINTIQSNRVDGVEQFVQSFLKFINCDIEEDTVTQLRKMGAIVLKSVNGMNSDVDLVSQELNQAQTQTIVDYLYDMVLQICGLPSTQKGGKSTSDTGNAVFLRDGWAQAESRAQITEKLWRKSEREFLKLVLRIIGDTRDIDLKLSAVECKFTRRQHDNLQSKCQALSALLQAGIHPEIAIATSGLFNDPTDVYSQSVDYLKKWEPVTMEPELDSTETADENSAEDTSNTEQSQAQTDANTSERDAP